MTESVDKPDMPVTPVFDPWAVFPALAFALATAVAIPSVVVFDLPVIMLPLIPIGAAALAALLWRTQWGLCFAAFAIMPLGIIEREIAGLTINLPEMVILALAFKELIRFLAHPRPLPDTFPARSFLAYLAGSMIGVLTGIRYGYPAVPILQDFRQFSEYIALFLLVVVTVDSIPKARQIAACYLLGAGLIATHGIIQRFTAWGIPGTQMLSDAILHGGVRSGSFYGATPLGGLMVLACGVACGLLLSARWRLLRFLFAGIFVLCITAAVFTNTRASWIAIGIVLLIVFFAVRKTPLMVAAALAGGAVFFSIFGAQVVHRLQSIAVTKSERSLLDRIQHYTVAWYLFRERPLLGYGFGNYFDVKTILVNRRYVPVQHVSEKFSSARSTTHSAYLQILVKTGLIGLIAFLAFLFSWFIGLLRAHHKRGVPEDMHALLIGVSAGVVGYLVHSAAENFFQWPVMSQSFWMLLGLSVVLISMALGQTEKPGGTEQTQPEPEVVR